MYPFVVYHHLLHFNKSKFRWLYFQINFYTHLESSKVDRTNFHLFMNCKDAQNHPKVDYTKHPISDDLQACSESSKVESKFGLLFSSSYIGNNRHDISHNWQIIHIWMIYVDHKSSTFGSGTYLEQCWILLVKIMSKCGIFISQDLTNRIVELYSNVSK